MNLNDRFDQLEEQLPESFNRTRAIDLFPNSVTQFVTRGENSEEAAVRETDLVLCEVAMFRQLPANGERAVADAECANIGIDDPRRFYALEIFVALPGHQVGTMVEDEHGERTFEPLKLYSRPRWNALTNQTPVLYGQQMQANPEEVARLHQTLLDGGFSAVEIGTSSQGEVVRSERRKEGWRLGLSVPANLKSSNTRQNYLNELAFRIEHSLRLDHIEVNSADDNIIETRNGFSDFADVLDRSVQAVIEDEKSTDPDQKDNAQRLLSSTTGFRYDKDRGRRFPVRAGTPVFKIAGVEREFSFWHTVPSVEGGPSPVVATDTAVPFA